MSTSEFQIPSNGGEIIPDTEFLTGYAELSNEGPLFDDMSIGNAQSAVDLAFEEVPAAPVYEETPRRSPEALHHLELSLGEISGRLALVRRDVIDGSLHGQDQNLFDLVA